MAALKDEPVFAKLGCTTLLDLALCVPKTYENRKLAASFKNGAQQCFDVSVKGVRRQNNLLLLQLFVHDLDTGVTATIFHPKPFHFKIFAINERLYISAKTGMFNGTFQLTQPKKLSSVGFIEPLYKRHKIRQDSMRALMRKYVTKDALAAAGLNEKEIATLEAIHFPQAPVDFEEESVLGALKSIEALNHMQKTAAKKHDYPAYRPLTASIERFLTSLPFTLTREQKEAIEAIRNDLAREKAAKRMIVGDVGSGKTMAILAAAATAYPHKALLMAPTSILAMQLYGEAKKYLDFDVALVSANKSEGDYKRAPFVIGTHALLYKDDLPRPDLVMVDEQHRFGVKQRQGLAMLMGSRDRRPHFLQFSATPIPRTQAMMESKMIDVSLITTTPFEKDITSRVIGPADFGELKAHIESEIQKGHQSLIIYPLVSESENFQYQSLEEGQSYWFNHFSKVYVTHGKDKNKDAVLEEFAASGNILLATTVVEVGISLPKLSTIVIVGAENMGLATLHQLRGRVSRNGLKGYCYLFTKSKKTDRLQKFCQTSSGFDIAKLDLAYRKSGDVLDGKVQSGAQFEWLDMSRDDAIIEAVSKRVKG